MRANEFSRQNLNDKENDEGDECLLEDYNSENELNEAASNLTQQQQTKNDKLINAIELDTINESISETMQNIIKLKMKEESQAKLKATLSPPTNKPKQQQNKCVNTAAKKFTSAVCTKTKTATATIVNKTGNNINNNSKVSTPSTRINSASSSTSATLKSNSTRLVKTDKKVTTTKTDTVGSTKLKKAVIKKPLDSKRFVPAATPIVPPITVESDKNQIETTDQQPTTLKNEESILVPKPVETSRISEKKADKKSSIDSMNDERFDGLEINSNKINLIEKPSSARSITNNQKLSFIINNDDQSHHRILSADKYLSVKKLPITGIAVSLPTTPQLEIKGDNIVLLPGEQSQPIINDMYENYPQPLHQKYPTPRIQIASKAKKLKKKVNYSNKNAVGSKSIKKSKISLLQFLYLNNKV
jgi:hypothetical protein